MIASIGLGTLEIRGWRPYRILDPNNYNSDMTIFIESVEVSAIKDPIPEYGPSIFSGKSAIYYAKKNTLMIRLVISCYKISH